PPRAPAPAERRRARVGPIVVERVVTMLRELARTAEDLPRCDSDARRARAAESYNLLSARLAEVAGAERELDQALGRALEDDDPGVRMAALKAFARRRRVDAALPASGMLVDPDPRVRLEAARTLERLAAPAAAPHL